MKPTHDRDRTVSKLLAWYDDNKRILPWRDHPTPYAVWVSEIMLQQTRVEAVKPYFQRFMKALPTLADLARCDDDQLIKLWEGLGYYNRVRNMKKCAIICMEQYQGELPADTAALLQLPGIGSYTAGAIASIAYRIPVCAVDGNVMRVFSRILSIEDDITKEATKQRFRTLLQEYVPKRCDAFNQAVMELGALICIPNGAPHCDICPVCDECIAYQCHDVKRLPIKSAKKKRTVEQHTVLVIVYQNKVHLLQRPTQGLLANLYQFDFLDGEFSKQDVKAYCNRFAHIKKMHSLPAAKHIFTHKEWHMKGWLIYIDSLYLQEGIWCDQAELLHTYAIASAFQVYKEIALQALEEVMSDESKAV